MELRQLESFSKIARLLSFRRAAGEMGVTQPALTQQVMHLERELGVRLFDRHTRPIRLTPAGSAMLERIQPLLAEFESAFAAVRQLGQPPDGCVTLGTSGGSPIFLPHVLAA